MLSKLGKFCGIFFVLANFGDSLRGRVFSKTCNFMKRNIVLNSFTDRLRETLLNTWWPKK